MEIYFTSNNKKFKAVFETFSKKEIDIWKNLLFTFNPETNIDREVVLKG